MTIETFQLVKEVCLLAHINTREEKHGKESKKGYDLKFVADMHNSVLCKFHPDLRPAFYRADDTQDLATPDNMPHLRMPMIQTISYDLEIPRALLRIHDPDNPANDFVLGGGKINAFKFLMKNGGSVQVTFRVQFSNPDEEEMFKAFRVEFQKVRVSLESAAEEAKPDNFEQAEQLSKEPMSEARQEAESLFSKPAVGAASPEELVMAPLDGDVVDAELTTEAEPSNVEQITRAKRGGSKRSASAAVE